MNHTHEVRERAHFRPVYETSFVGHLRLSRASFHMIFSVLYSKKVGKREAEEKDKGLGHRKTELSSIVTKGILA